MSTDEAIKEICDLLGLYPLTKPEQVVERVLFLRTDDDARQFTITCLLAERRTLLNALEERGVSEVEGIPLTEIAEKGLPL